MNSAQLMKNGFLEGAMIALLAFIPLQLMASSIPFPSLGMERGWGFFSDHHAANL